MNAVGMRTLLTKEIRRFLRVPVQTLLSPLVSTSLYFIVFGYSLARHGATVHGVGYMEFIVPGLVFLGVSNNAFLNSSSSLFMMKIQGTIVDLLVAPLGPVEMLAGFVGGAVVRGLIVGLLTWGVAALFVPVPPAHALVAIAFLLLVPYTFAVLGVLAALWAEKFEEVNFFPTFVMLPLTFLGGVFYSVVDLPQPWRGVSLANPVVYMVDGLRYGMLGQSALSPALGAAVLCPVALLATALAYALIRRGYKLRQ